MFQKSEYSKNLNSPNIHMFKKPNQKAPKLTYLTDFVNLDFHCDNQTNRRFSSDDTACSLSCVLIMSGNFYYIRILYYYY